MDPFVVFDAQQVLPNRFGLALAAASRARALNHGHFPRIEPSSNSGPIEIALSEISAGAFDENELAPFAASGDNIGRLEAPRGRNCDSGLQSIAVASASQVGERHKCGKASRKEKQDAEDSRTSLHL